MAVSEFNPSIWLGIWVVFQCVAITDSAEVNNASSALVYIFLLR